MLVETLIQFVGPMLLEMAVREVAVPAAKKIAQNKSGLRQDQASGCQCGNAETPVLTSLQAVRVVSALPGRVRFEVAGLSGRVDLAQRLGDEIGSLAGVTQIAANARTGRVLVMFDPEQQAIGVLSAAIERARAKHLSPAAGTTRRLAAVVGALSAVNSLSDHDADVSFASRLARHGSLHMAVPSGLVVR
jgi:Heavy metal associated domain 2